MRFPPNLGELLIRLALWPVQILVCIGWRVGTLRLYKIYLFFTFFPWLQWWILQQVICVFYVVCRKSQITGELLKTEIHQNTIQFISWSVTIHFRILLLTFVKDYMLNKSTIIQSITLFPIIHLKMAGLCCLLWSYVHIFRVYIIQLRTSKQVLRYNLYCLLLIEASLSFVA